MMLSVIELALPIAAHEEGNAPPDDEGSFFHQTHA